MPEPVAASAAMPSWLLYYPIVRDLIIVLVGGALIYLLFTERRFHRDQIKTLLGRQQALEQEAVTQKAYTDRLVALFRELSPEKLVERVKATEELRQRNLEAELAAVEKNLSQRLQKIGDERDAEKTKAELWESRALTAANLLAQTLVHFAFALRLHPKVIRENLLGWINDKTVRSVTDFQLTTLEERFGPSPADRSAFAMLPFYLSAKELNEQRERDQAAEGESQALKDES
jgi:hypothetical protein